MAGGAVVLCLGGCGDEADVDILKRDLTISLGEHPELAEAGQSALIEAGLKSPISVTRTGDESFVVTGTECNHAACSVQRSGEGWRCPCHGSTFQLGGALTRGPATAGLIVYDFTLEGDTLTVLGQ